MGQIHPVELCEIAHIYLLFRWGCIAPALLIPHLCRCESLWFLHLVLELWELGQYIPADIPQEWPGPVLLSPRNAPGGCPYQAFAGAFQTGCPTQRTV